MKRFLNIIGVLMLAMVLCVTAFAISRSEYHFIYDSTEIIVSGNLLSYTEAEEIAHFVLSEDEITLREPCSNRSILCDIFGHKLQTSAALVIEHNVSPTQPKCVQYEYEVTSCTRSSCDYIIKELKMTMCLYSCH
jgi:hypothetical protein